MSLSNRLKEATVQASNSVCKVGSLLISDKLSKEEKTLLDSILNVPLDYPGRVSSSELNRIFRDEGFDISKSSIDRHRSESCPCTRKIQQ
jgi:hypothetical protein